MVCTPQGVHIAERHIALRAATRGAIFVPRPGAAVTTARRLPISRPRGYRGSAGESITPGVDGEVW